MVRLDEPDRRCRRDLDAAFVPNAGYPSFLAATALYLFGGPIVHFAQGRPHEIAAQSFGARLLVPGVGLGAAICKMGEGRRSCDVGKYAVIGLIVGMAAASAFDGAYFAYETAPARAEMTLLAFTS